MTLQTFSIQNCASNTVNTHTAKTLQDITIVKQFRVGDEPNDVGCNQSPTFVVDAVVYGAKTAVHLPHVEDGPQTFTWPLPSSNVQEDALHGISDLLKRPDL